MKQRCAIALVCAMAFVVGGAACAQTFPTKPIRLVVGSFPGGGNDLVGRILAIKLSDSLGQQVIIDNLRTAAARAASTLRSIRHCFSTTSVQFSFGSIGAKRKR